MDRYNIADMRRLFGGDPEGRLRLLKDFAGAPGGSFISTPVGRYNPDWAIAFKVGSVKHICFVAETKGSMSSL